MGRMRGRILRQARMGRPGRRDPRTARRRRVRAGTRLHTDRLLHARPSGQGHVGRARYRVRAHTGAGARVRHGQFHGRHPRKHQGARVGCGTRSGQRAHRGRAEPGRHDPQRGPRGLHHPPGIRPRHRQRALFGRHQPRLPDHGRRRIPPPPARLLRRTLGGRAAPRRRRDAADQQVHARQTLRDHARRPREEGRARRRGAPAVLDVRTPGRHRGRHRRARAAQARTDARPHARRGMDPLRTDRRARIPGRDRQRQPGGRRRHASTRGGRHQTGDRTVRRRFRRRLPG